MKIRNAIRIDQTSETISEGKFARPEDIAFIHELVQRTVLPRYFVVEKGEERFEFIAQHKQLVGFKSDGKLQLVDGKSDILKQNECVKEFIQSFGTLSDDDELTVKRVDSAILASLPDAGVDLNAIDFSEEIIAPEVETTNYTLRVVVDNEHLDDKNEAPAKEVAEITPTTASIPAEPTNTVGAVREFYEHVHKHANYAVLKSREGDTLDSYGFLPDFDASVFSGLTDNLCKFDKAAINSLGAEPKLISMAGHKSDNKAMIYVISRERILIAEIGTTKLGRIIMDWNALLATKVEK